MDADAVKQKLQKMFGGSNVQTGGKGSVRRKHKAVRKHAAQDDKKLQSTLKKMQVNPIPGIEEVNLFKEDGSIIHFVNPKVQASIAANIYVVSGDAQNKKLEELLPGILPQLGADGLETLRKLASSFQGGASADDDVPELVENFEDASKK